MFYQLAVVYSGFGELIEERLDNIIKKTIHKRDCSSGYGVDGRDLCFNFKTLKDLMNAVKRLKNNKKLKRQIKIVGYSPNGDKIETTNYMGELICQ